MSSIRTGIELQDNFTSVLYGIISSVNLAMASMDDMNRAMNANVDTSSLEGARDEINKVTIALDELNETAQKQVEIDTAVIQPQSFAPPVEVPPVEVPVVWNTDGLDVFTTTGIDRFEQEIQSSNTMLKQLSNTQALIEQQASSMDILPDAALQDIVSVGQRLQAVQERISAIENNPLNLGTDLANTELEQLRSQLNQMVQEQNNLNTAMENMDVSAANESYLRLSTSISNTERYIRDNVDEQGLFNQEISEGVGQANQLMNTVKGAVAAYVSLQSVGKVINISDELVQTTARIDLMNDEMQTTGELTNLIYAAAQDARGSFSGMASVVARFGNNAKDAFDNSEEVVAFANLVQKQMTIAGASATESANAMLQLSQGLGSGVLRGDELNSIFEQAPNLIQNIADYLGEPIGSIRDMASEGELTADIVKAAIFAASDDINSQFEQMPMTWSQVWQSMENTALMAFTPILQRINDIANSDGFQTFVNGAIETMAVLANVALNTFDTIAMASDFVVSNWSLLEPLILGVAAAFAFYTSVLTANSIAQGINAGIKGIMALKASVHAAALAMEAGVTAVATANQYGFNAALLACPITWIILSVIALIAALFAISNAIANATGVAQSGFGIIMGVVAVAGAFIINIFIQAINLVIGYFVILWNCIASFANFVATALDSPATAIANTFGSLADYILGTIQTLASAIDALFGSNLSSAVSGWRDSLGSWVSDTYGDSIEVMSKVSSEDWKIDEIGYKTAFDVGASWGDGIAETVSNFSLSDLFGSVDMPSSDYNASAYDTSGLTDIASTADDIAGNTSAIADSIAISEEDLKYLRELAEQEVVNRFTTAEIKIDMGGVTNQVSNNNDLDGMIDHLVTTLEEAMEISAEGVHA